MIKNYTLVDDNGFKYLKMWDFVIKIHPSFKNYIVRVRNDDWLYIKKQDVLVFDQALIIGPCWQ